MRKFSNIAHLKQQQIAQAVSPPPNHSEVAKFLQDLEISGRRPRFKTKVTLMLIGAACVISPVYEYVSSYEARNVSSRPSIDTLITDEHFALVEDLSSLDENRLRALQKNDKNFPQVDPELLKSRIYNPEISWFQRNFCIGYRRSTGCSEKALHPMVQYMESQGLTYQEWQEMHGQKETQKYNFKRRTLDVSPKPQRSWF